MPSLILEKALPFILNPTVLPVLLMLHTMNIFHLAYLTSVIHISYIIQYHKLNDIDLTNHLFIATAAIGLLNALDGALLTLLSKLLILLL